MTSTRWEYKSLLINVSGWIGPKIDTDGIDEVLNHHGMDGWEVVSAFDINRHQGQTGSLMIMLKRPR